MIANKEHFGCMFYGVPSYHKFCTPLYRPCDALRETDTMNLSHCFALCSYMVDRFQDSIAVTLTEVYSQIHL